MRISGWPLAQTVLWLVIALAVLAVATQATRAYLAQARNAWHDGAIVKPAQLGFEDVTLTLADDVIVRGWYLAPRNAAVLMLVHGSPANRAELLPEATGLARAGFGILLLDMPGWGESGGQPTWGAPSRAALRAGIDLVMARPGVERVGLYGFSMGSCVAAQVAASDARVSAVVLAGAFTSLEAQLRHAYGSWGSITTWPATWAARRHGLAVDELDTLQAVRQLAGRPLLLVYGTDDNVVPAAMTEQVFAAAPEPKQRLVVKGAAHGDYAQVMGDAYVEQLAEFYTAALQQTLQPKRATN
jgi:uncharacterized protein